MQMSLLHDRKYMILRSVAFARVRRITLFLRYLERQTGECLLQREATSIDTLGKRTLFSRPSMNMCAFSMGSVGDPYENALCESFFGTPRLRIARSTSLQVSRRGPDGSLSIHRGLVQPVPPAFCPRLLVPDQLRKDAPRCRFTHETAAAPPSRINSTTPDLNSRTSPSSIALARFSLGQCF